MIEKLCQKCNKPFSSKPSSNGKFCSATCYYDFCNARTLTDKICECCRGKFIGKSTRKYCSKECQSISFANLNRTEKVEKVCLICSKTHFVSIFKKVRLETCSSECHKIYRKIFKCQYPKVCKKCDIVGCENVITMNLDRLDRSEKHFCSSKCVQIYRTNLAFLAKKCTSTRPELKFSKYLIKNEIQFKTQFNIPWKCGWKKWFDFYLPEINTLIEVDGTYWHGKNLEDGQLNNQQIRTRENDKLKNQLALDRDYKLIRIWEDEIDDFNFELLKGNYENLRKIDNNNSRNS